MLGHVDIFLDESGDLGFSTQRCSKYFVVCALATPDVKAMSRLPRRVRDKVGIGNCPEMKFSKSQDPLRRTVLEELSRSECGIVWGAMDKQSAQHTNRRDNELYCEICSKVLCEAFRRVNARRIHVVLDRRSNRKDNRDELDDYIASALHTCHSGYFVPEYEISHFDSARTQCLQVCDFVTGSIFQMLERNDTKYSDIISEKIIFGKIY